MKTVLNPTFNVTVDLLNVVTCRVELANVLLLVRVLTGVLDEDELKVISN